MPERGTCELFLPLVRATLDNVAARGPVAALTGPLSRGDEGTIAAHLEALSADASRSYSRSTATSGSATLDTRDRHAARSRPRSSPE